MWKYLLKDYKCRHLVTRELASAGRDHFWRELLQRPLPTSRPPSLWFTKTLAAFWEEEPGPLGDKSPNRKDEGPWRSRPHTRAGGQKGESFLVLPWEAAASLSGAEMGISVLVKLTNKIAGYLTSKISICRNNRRIGKYGKPQASPETKKREGQLLLACRKTSGTIVLNTSSLEKNKSWRLGWFLIGFRSCAVAGAGIFLLFLASRQWNCSVKTVPPLSRMIFLLSAGYTGCQEWYKSDRARSGLPSSVLNEFSFIFTPLKKVSQGRAIACPVCADLCRVSPLPCPSQCFEESFSHYTCSHHIRNASLSALQELPQKCSFRFVTITSEPGTVSGMYRYSKVFGEWSK